jgi:hypothetical protein
MVRFNGLSRRIIWQAAEDKAAEIAINGAGAVMAGGRA